MFRVETQRLAQSRDVRLGWSSLSKRCLGNPRQPIEEPIVGFNWPVVSHRRGNLGANRPSVIVRNSLTILRQIAAAAR